MFSRKITKFSFNKFKLVEKLDYYSFTRGNIEYVVEHFRDGYHIATTYDISKDKILRHESPCYKTTEECLAFFDGLEAKI